MTRRQIEQLLLGIAHLAGAWILLYPILFQEREFVQVVDKFGPMPDLYSVVIVMAGMRLMLMGALYITNQRQM